MEQIKNSICSIPINLYSIPIRFIAYLLSTQRYGFTTTVSYEGILADEFGGPYNFIFLILLSITSLFANKSIRRSLAILFGMAICIRYLNSDLYLLCVELILVIQPIIEFESEIVDKYSKKIALKKMDKRNRISR